MPRPEYYDPSKPSLYIADLDPVIKQDFLDICQKLDLVQREAFKVIVEDYYTRHKIKPRPSRKKS